MKRSIISLIGILTFSAIAQTASSAMADNKDGNVTVSFGLWDPNDPDLSSPLDRLVGDPTVPPGAGVNDILIPDNVTIKAGDAVNFIISGGHVVTVYADGTKPEDIDTSVIEPATNCPTTAGGVINDPIIESTVGHALVLTLVQPRRRLLRGAMVLKSSNSQNPARTS